MDGKQHFEQIGKWLSPEKNRKNDLYKMNCANKNGFSVIRILQKDVYYDKYDWLNELHRPERKMRQKSIKKIKNHSIILSNGANAPRRALYYLTTTTCYGCSG